MKFFKLSTIIYTNHETIFDIFKQTILSTSFTNKLNFRFVRVSDYIQRFDLIIRHKSKKLHVVLDALSRFLTSNSKSTIENEDELNMLFINAHFTVSLIAINDDFKKRVISEYVENSDWQKIINVLNNAKKNQIKVFFMRKNELIFRKKINDTSFILRKMCISSSMIKKILNIAHDKRHSEFDHTYNKLISSWYIRNLTKHFHVYLKHCSICNKNRTKRHKSYESLQSILFSSISFHILTIDFVLELLLFRDDMNSIMSVTCKFSKRITTVSEINTWIATQWAKALLNKLNITDWNLSKMIIFDRNRKFLSELWIALFALLNVKLLYSTTYHSQTNDVSEKINQILEIALRSLIFIIKNARNWSKFLDCLQRQFNNISTAVDRSFNEICYEFTFFTSFSLINTTSQEIFSKNSNLISQLTRMQIEDNIAHDQMFAKMYYDKKHKFIQFNHENWILLRLHKDYDISNTVALDFKLFQQYTELFQILKKMRILTYKFDISSSWRVHSIFSIAQFKFAETLSADSFKRTTSSFDSVFVKEDTNKVKSFEIEKIVTIRISRREKKYLIRWLKYDSKHDQWKNLSEMKNVMKFVNNYEQSYSTLLNSRRNKRLINR